MNINEQVKKEAKRGIIEQFIGILSAALPLMAILGISLEWFNESFISALNVFLIALIPFGYNVYSIWKNHFSGKKAQEQNRAIKQKGLK